MAESMTRRRSSRLRTLAKLTARVAWVGVLGGCASMQSRDPEFLTFGRPLTYPFTPVVRVGDMLYLSGQIGTDSAGRIVPGGIQAETRQTLDNIRDLVTRSGSSMDRVVKCTAMLVDMKEWPAMNEVYTTYFPNHKPARSAFGATGLALNARVEIECWALR
jgi:2-iminobutanoate/2-iminopropanoate deaminase